MPPLAAEELFPPPVSCKSEMLTCAICLEELNSAALTLSCLHQFHATCVADWFRRGNPACPSCRDVPEAYRREPPDAEAVSIVTESTLNDVADRLAAHPATLDPDTESLLCRFFVIRARLCRLRALSALRLFTHCRPAGAAGARGHRRRRCQDYAAAAFEYEDELAALGAELLARHHSDGVDSDDAATSSSGDADSKSTASDET